MQPSPTLILIPEAKAMESLSTSLQKEDTYPKKYGANHKAFFVYNNYEVLEPPTEYVYHEKVATIIWIGGQD